MAQEYLQELKINNLPRLPLEGSIDLTYRCNNNCRHCWLRIPADSPQRCAMSKKKWKKPKLIVLVKMKAGESILQGCKSGLAIGPTQTPFSFFM